MNNCIFCDEELESVPNEQDVYEGGIVRFIFSFGSTKFDKCIGDTIFRGFICDHCAEKFVNKMKEEHRNV